MQKAGTSKVAATPLTVPDATPWPHRGYAWYVVFMLMLAYAFSIVDRTGLGLLVQPIEVDLHISDSRMGLLQGAAFAIFYSMLGLPLGYLADRVNRRALIGAGITIWSAATVLCGMATGFSGLFAARVGVGAGEATLGPTGPSLIADYFPPHSRAKAFGVFFMGTALGVAAAFLLGGGAIRYAGAVQAMAPNLLGALHPWNIVFFMIGAPGLLVGLLFVITVREPVRRNRVGVGGTWSPRPALSLLKRNWRIYSGLIGWAVLNSTGIYALVNWFPTYLIRVHGWDAASIGQILGMYGAPCGIFSCVSAGWLLAWLEKTGRADAVILVGIGGTLWVTLTTVAACLAPTGNLAVIAFLLQSLGTNNAGIAMMTAISRITPNEMRGQVIALVGLGTGLISVSVGPFAVGVLSDTVFGAAHGVGESIAAVVGTVGSLGVLLLASIRRRFSITVRNTPEN